MTKKTQSHNIVRLICFCHFLSLFKPWWSVGFRRIF